MVFYPVCKAAFKLLLRITGYSYLTLENLPRFVRHPATVVVLIIILLACSLFYLVESVSLIVFYQGYVREEKIGVIQVLFPGISRAAELLRKKKARAHPAFFPVECPSHPLANAVCVCRAV